MTCDVNPWQDDYDPWAVLQAEDYSWPCDPRGHTMPQADYTLPREPPDPLILATMPGIKVVGGGEATPRTTSKGGGPQPAFAARQTGVQIPPPPTVEPAIEFGTIPPPPSDPYPDPPPQKPLGPPEGLPEYFMKKTNGVTIVKYRYSA